MNRRRKLIRVRAGLLDRHPVERENLGLDQV
jgi:hypothetical protein